MFPHNLRYLHVQTAHAGAGVANDGGFAVEKYDNWRGEEYSLSLVVGVYQERGYIKWLEQRKLLEADITRRIKSNGGVEVITFTHAIIGDKPGTVPVGIDIVWSDHKGARLIAEFARVWKALITWEVA
jgi:hypothetical protein